MQHHLFFSDTGFRNFVYYTKQNNTETKNVAPTLAMVLTPTKKKRWIKLANVFFLFLFFPNTSPRSTQFTLALFRV